MSVFDGILKLSASTASGTELVTKRELTTLGYEPFPAIYGRIPFLGTMSDVAKANIHLRTASRVYIHLAEFEATTFDELFEGVRNIPWEEVFPPTAKVIVNARSIRSMLSAISAVQSVVKKAIVERIKSKKGALTEDGETYTIEAGLTDDRVIIALDTSGEGLHKRGYRTMVGEAPIRETLAASIILMSVWKWDRPLIDPFCGSGTIPIEAAMIATNTPPGINRNFSFENFSYAPHVIGGIMNEAESEIIRDRKLRITGYDIDKEAIRLANYHAEKSGMASYIHLQAADMRTISSRFSHGVIIANPPYGERLMKGSELMNLYRDFSKVAKDLTEWSTYIISSYPYVESCFNKKSEKKRRLYNSEIECTLYRFMGKPPERNTGENATFEKKL